MVSTNTYTSLEDALKDYTVEFLEMSLYEVAQLVATDQLNDKLKTYFEANLADLSVEECESLIAQAAEQIDAQLDAVSDYADDLADQIEAAQEAGEVSQATSDQRLLTEVQALLAGDLINLTTLVPEELYRLGGLVIESDQDEYFLYDTMESNMCLGGETVRYNLTGVINDSALTAETVNPADLDGNGVADLDFNGDLLTDAQDIADAANPVYDSSGQEFNIELNPGDKIISCVYDKELKLFSFEIETAARTITADDGSSLELTPKTFMLEVQVTDPEAAHIVFIGDDYASPSVFDIDPEAQGMLYDQAPVTSMRETLNPDYDTPTLDLQLAALEGFTEFNSHFADTITSLNSAFAANENPFAFPADAETILRDMAAAVFDNNLTNSYSECSAEDAAANFNTILNKYSETERAALTMAFCLAFIKKDQAAGTTQFSEMMGSEIYNMSDIIDVYADKDGASIGMIEKAMHLAIESAFGNGPYTDTRYGDVITGGLTCATATGVEGPWKDHEENIAACQFLIDNNLDTKGLFATTITLEQGLMEGAISIDEASSLNSELSSIATDDLFVDWQIDLAKDDWMNATTYLSNHLLTEDGQLVDDPLSVFKDCLEKFFGDGNGGWKVGADNFASTFLYACDIRGALGGGLDTLMTGTFGKDIAKYLWDVSNNGGTDPKFLSEAKSYYNSIV